MDSSDDECVNREFVIYKNRKTLTLRYVHAPYRPTVTYGHFYDQNLTVIRLEGVSMHSHPKSHKMKKTTTPVQFEILVNYLREHSDMIAGIPDSTVSLSGRRQLWLRLTEKLNRHGPPVRNYTGWKSIWSDYKYNLKRKLATNVKLAKRGNGSKRLLFNQTEQAAIELMRMRDTALGNTKSVERLTECAANSIAVDNALQADVIIDDFKEELYVASDFDSNEQAPPPADEYYESLPVEQGLVEAPEFDMDMWAEVKETLVSIEKTQQAILKELKDSNQHKERSLKLKERMLQLEQGRLQEQKIQTELKRKKLELYELELKGMCKACPIKRELV